MARELGMEESIWNHQVKVVKTTSRNHKMTFRNVILHFTSLIFKDARKKG